MMKYNITHEMLDYDGRFDYEGQLYLFGPDNPPVGGIPLLSTIVELASIIISAVMHADLTESILLGETGRFVTVSVTENGDLILKVGRAEARLNAAMYLRSIAEAYSDIRRRARVEHPDVNQYSMELEDIAPFLLKI